MAKRNRKYTFRSRWADAMSSNRFRQRQRATSLSIDPYAAILLQCEQQRLLPRPVTTDYGDC